MEKSSSDEKPKKVIGVSPRLLQNTASSSARSTPTLTRKFGPQKPATPKFGSARKNVENKPKLMTSSAKKSVFNSTSENENVVPTDWDASAIEKPIVEATIKDQPQKRITGDNFFVKLTCNSLCDFTKFFILQLQ